MQPVLVASPPIPGNVFNIQIADFRVEAPTAVEEMHTTDTDDITDSDTNSLRALANEMYPIRRQPLSLAALPHPFGAAGDRCHCARLLDTPSGP